MDPASYENLCRLRPCGISTPSRSAGGQSRHSRWEIDWVRRATNLDYEELTLAHIQRVLVVNSRVANTGRQHWPPNATQAKASTPERPASDPQGRGGSDGPDRN